MSILIIDRDETAVGQISTLLNEQKIDFDCVLTRDQAMEALRSKAYHAVIIDPAPQNEIRPFVMGARRMAKQYPYILLTSRTVDHNKALAGGCNELMEKPLDMVKLAKKINSASHLGKIIGRMADESEDFPSNGGVIAKSAFNQLFISCLDRADRYGEQSYMIFVRISNFADIISNGGAEELERCSAALKKYLARIRRLSDIIGQTATYEYTLLLLRTTKDDEPFLAANRFAETLREYHDLISLSSIPVELSVGLFTVPSGDTLVEHRFSNKAEIS